MIKIFIVTMLLPSFLLGQYFGGNGGGYTNEYLESMESISVGAAHSGYTLASFIIPVSVSKGGNGDGYDLYYTPTNISVSKGGPDDGYAMLNHFFTFTWTGNVSMDWNNINNWQEPWIPDFHSIVTIPEDADFFPRINSGLLRIASASGDYSCRGLHIETGAEMTIGPSAFVQNNGWINIKGALVVENPNLQAFWNRGCALVLIKTGGQLIFQPGFLPR